MIDGVLGIILGFAGGISVGIILTAAVIYYKL
jgi:hypothetical protein